MKTYVALLVSVISLLLTSGCCQYPFHYAADRSTRSARAVLASPREVEAYLGTNFKRSSLNPRIECPPRPLLKMAPVAPEENGRIRFGAFAVRHGNKQEVATVYWWSQNGALRNQTIVSADASAISFVWINERTIRFEWGHERPGSKVVRLDDADFECSFPYSFSADSGTKSAKAVVASPTKVEAYLGGSLARFTLAPPIKCPPHPVVAMAPVAADENGNIHFGAFAVRHGNFNDTATVLWWDKKAEKLRTYNIASSHHAKVSFTWINERTIRFQLGKDSKTVRLNEDDGPPFTEL